MNLLVVEILGAARTESFLAEEPDRHRIFERSSSASATTPEFPGLRPHGNSKWMDHDVTFLGTGPRPEKRFADWMFVT